MKRTATVRFVVIVVMLTDVATTAIAEAGLGRVLEAVGAVVVLSKTGEVGGVG